MWSLKILWVVTRPQRHIANSCLKSASERLHESSWRRQIRGFWRLLACYSYARMDAYKTDLNISCYVIQCKEGDFQQWVLLNRSGFRLWQHHRSGNRVVQGGGWLRQWRRLVDGVDSDGFWHYKGDWMGVVCGAGRVSAGDRGDNDSWVLLESIGVDKWGLHPFRLHVWSREATDSCLCDSLAFGSVQFGLYTSANGVYVLENRIYGAKNVWTATEKII